MSMETRLHCVHSAASFSLLPQVGSNYSKGVDHICLGVSMAGGLLGSCPTSRKAFSASCFSVMKPLLVVNCSQRTQFEQLVDDTMGGKVFSFVEGDMAPTRHRMRRRHDTRSRTPSRKIKVRSFVDEATANSADVELNNPSAVSERDSGEAGGSDFDQGVEFRESDDEVVADKEAFDGVNDSALAQKSFGKDDQRDEEDGDYGPEDVPESVPGVKIIQADSSPSVDLEYNYEDMRIGEKKNWSVADMEKLDLLRNFEYRYGSEQGVLVVQAMRVEHMKPIEELLVDSFAELMGGLLTYRPLLALTVRQYVRERYSCLPDVVTLVGLYAPAEDNVVMGRTENEFSGNWLVAGTVEVSFSNAGHPDIPSGPAPPPGSPYLCNMAVSSTYRRRGLGRQLLKAAEDVAVMMGAKDLYLHCRMVDLAPLNMYKSAGYQIIATDSILSLLTLQRRRYLMRKRLPALSPSTNGR